MPAPALDAVCQVLARDSRLGHDVSETIGLLMDLLYYGEFSIYEQVASSGLGEVVDLMGAKGPPGMEGALWLGACAATSAAPRPASWRGTGGDPFGARIDRAAGVVRGLGAASGKVDLVLQVLAASSFSAEELTRPVAVVGMFGNEASATGIRTLLADQPAPSGLVLGAPTNLELWTDHPGCLALRLVIRREVRYRRMPPCRGIFEVQVPGASAHAQTTGLGVDALSAALAMLGRIGGGTQTRVLAIEAGSAPNRVAEHCRLILATAGEELPPLPEGVLAEAMPDGAAVPFPIDPLLNAWVVARDAGVAAVGDGFAPGRNVRGARPRLGVHTGRLVSDRDEISGELTFWSGPGVDVRAQVERFAEAASRALAGREELELDIDVLQNRPAFAGRDSGAELLGTAKRVLSDVGIPPVLSAGLLTTDAGFSTERGIPAFAFGPGRGMGDLFRDDEAVPIRHLETALEFYRGLIRAWCTG